MFELILFDYVPELDQDLLDISIKEYLNLIR